MIETLYKNFDGYVKQMAGRTKSVHDAEDIVQDAFERALRYKHAAIGEPDAWFGTILHNAYKDWCRDQRMQGMTVEYDEMLDKPIPMIDDDTYEIFDRALLTRGTLDRQILYLHFKCGLTPREVSHVVDSTPGNVSRAIYQLRRELKEEFGHG